MNRFIRYWNQNRKKIIIAIVIVAFAILLVKTINYIIGQQNNNRNSLNEDVIIIDSSIPTESVTGGQSLSDQTAVSNTNIIKEFVDFCNNGDYQNAYDLLSDDCKEEVFHTVDEFKTNYYDIVFNTDKTYELELWHSNSGKYVYRIVYYENNILSTGQISSSNNIEDYITIIFDENWQSKLNIGGFISKDNINKASENQELKVTVNYKISYRSYETYSITVENKTDKTIMLSEGKNSNDICLIDNNQVEYDSMINEVPLADLEILPYSKKTINIKFNKIYEEYRIMEQMAFKNIIVDMDDFEQNSENAIKVSLNVAI